MHGNNASMKCTGAATLFSWIGDIGGGGEETGEEPRLEEIDVVSTYVMDCTNTWARAHTSHGPGAVAPSPRPVSRPWPSTPCRQSSQRPLLRHLSLRRPSPLRPSCPTLVLYVGRPLLLWCPRFVSCDPIPTSWPSPRLRFLPLLLRSYITWYTPFKLSIESGKYSKWRQLLWYVLCKYRVEDHVLEEVEPLDADATWRSNGITIVLWVHGTISHELYETIHSSDSTAFHLRQQLEIFFYDNATGRSIHIGADFCAMIQGDMMIPQYYRWLQNLASAMTDVGEPVLDRSFTLQLIRGLSRRFHIMATLLPIQQPFPTFLQVWSRLLLEEITINERERATGVTALAVRHDGSSSSGGVTPSDRAPPFANGQGQVFGCWRSLMWSSVRRARSWPRTPRSRLQHERRARPAGADALDRLFCPLQCSAPTLKQWCASWTPPTPRGCSALVLARHTRPTRHQLFLLCA
ncbi:hypothetical protein D1007_28000 [Hordeum vulgare]|nr:hypothetical protein D1007_28000 [Hordeum vulgare]